MMKQSMNPNAARALEELKMEIATEMGLSNSLTNDDPINNIFTAGPVGGLMTRRLVEMGEKQLINNKLE